MFYTIIFWLSFLGWCLIDNEAADPDRLNVPIVPYASLGRIFDKRRDALGISVLNSKAKVEELITNTSNLAMTTQYKFVESNQDANEMLNIDGSASLQLELGLVQGSASGAGGYLRSIDDRDNFAELLFSTTINMRNELLPINDESISGDKCKNSVLKGTHVITGIEYGANCIVSIRIKVHNKGEKDKISGSLNAKLTPGGKKLNISAEGTLEKFKETLKKMSNVTVYTFCNARLQKFPTTAEEGIDLAKEFPAMVKAQNPNGVPIRMELTPIDEIPQCARKTGFIAQNLFRNYFAETISMVQDLKVSYKRLWNCMEILVSGTSGKDIKKKAKALREKMKYINYQLKEFIDGVDYSRDNAQFDDVKRIYTEGKDVSTKAYGNRYWRKKVDDMCKELGSLQKQDDQTSFLQERACTVKDDLITDEIAGTLAGTTPDIKFAHDQGFHSCYDGAAQEGPTVWTAKLKKFTRNITAIEIYFVSPSGDKKQVEDIEVFISNKEEDFTAETRPESMHSIGKLKISDLNKNIGLKIKPTAIRGEITGNSGYVAVMRLESPKQMILCEVKVKGQQCPTIV